MSAQSPDFANLRLAVLIDADNAPRDCLKSVMEEIAIYGTPTIKRIYGDWTSPNIGGWKISLLENAVTPVQQYSYTTGKNSTDSAMIIDAMDILYAGKTDGFVLVSSDSDFTRLAIRLREAGMYVIGIGEHKTPSPFIVACDKFIYIEVIRERANKKTIAEEAKQAKSNINNKKKKTETQKKTVEKASEKHVEKTPDAKSRVPDSVIEFIADSVADLADEDGFADLSQLGNLLIKKQPDFDPRNFGFSKLSALMKYLDRFEVEVRSTNDPHVKPIFIRDKEA
ncbi:MAG TPA: NYN domain-containing protein [Clostridiales bacterium]|nr:NYN domain-containing protein [Clostridiales bacterium]